MIQFFLANLWKWKCGLPEDEWEINTANIEQTEWSSEFELLQRHRLLLGAMRYGRILAKGKSQWNRVPGMLKYIKKYEETGNLECLVDVANYCMLEFLESNHPNKHFHSTEDGYHVDKIW
jgi:hypothetical protein